MATPSWQIVASWVVYDQGPAMFPGLAYAPDGSLLASFSTVPDGLPGGEIHLIRSHDHGHTWGGAQVIARSDRPGGAALNALGLTALSDGTLLLPYNDVRTQSGYREREARLYLLRSGDGGRTWEGSGPVAGEVHEPLTYGQIVERPDGVLLWPIWGRYRREERWRAALLFSEDGGRHWGHYTTIAFDPEARLRGDYAQPAFSGFDEEGEFDPQALAQPAFRPHSPVDGFNETSLIRLADGRILAILRQQGVDGRQHLSFYRALSDDGGRTWFPYRRTNLCGMSPGLHISPGGQLLLAYRRCAPRTPPSGGTGAEPGLGLAYSRDAGLTWETLLTLREPKGSRYTAEYQVGYPALVNRPDGQILVVYYSYAETLPQRRYLAANLLGEVTRD
jgi:hypothetical protein